jgi:hypothetical protein
VSSLPKTPQNVHVTQLPAGYVLKTGLSTAYFRPCENTGSTILIPLAVFFDGAAID